MGEGQVASARSGLFHPLVAADADSSDADVGAGSLHFVAIDYKRDFKFVREIDDRFDPRLDAKKPKEK